VSLARACVVLSSISILGCGSLPLPAARVDAVRAAIDRAMHAGALRCAPREIALARAHYDFAQVELRNGNAARAQQHIAVAEQNVGAAQVLTPDRGCATGSDQVPAIPRSSVPARSAANAAADGGKLSAQLPLGAVKNTDAKCLTLSLAGRADSASALTASQMSQHDQSCGSADPRSLRLASTVNEPCLTPHLYGETRLDEAFAMSYAVLSIGDFELPIQSVHAEQRRMEISQVWVFPLDVSRCHGYGPARS
jgi:hypothetical protein